MMNDKLKYIQAVTGLLAAMTILVSCLHSPDITGRWQETRGRAIIEFHDDYTFSTVDNMGLALSGTYTLDNKGNVRFRIKTDEGETETIDARVRLDEDELIFNFSDTDEVERYKKVEQ